LNNIFLDYFFNDLMVFGLKKKQNLTKISKNHVLDKKIKKQYF